MPKNIVLCCDGTGNEYGSNNTNVVLTAEVAIKSEDQVVFYDPGVGTGGWAYDESTGNLRAMSDQATGVGLQRNVEDAYRYLMRTYEPGDKVFLFGFSRGAFTARATAGMVHKCGLLRPDLDNLVEYASKIYNTAGNQEIAAGFKSAFTRTCPVQFIGVWDTVKSLVMNANKRFHDATLNPEVSCGRHAVAIDEIRKDFPPYLWEHANSDRVQQVWFAGVHSDVGGWYDERGLSNLALQWMLSEARAKGLQIDAGALAKHAGDAHGTMHDSHTGFWNFRGKHRREIPAGAMVHGSVRARMARAENDYHPEVPPDVTWVE